MINQEKRKHIIVSLNNYKKIKDFAKFGETFNDAINRIFEKIDCLDQSKGIGGQ